MERHLYKEKTICKRFYKLLQKATRKFRWKNELKHDFQFVQDIKINITFFLKNVLKK